VTVLKSRACPWLSKKTADIRDPLLRFHNEIIEFHDYITPSPSERETRMLAFRECPFPYPDSNNSSKTWCPAAK
jgi:hypothetical protein